MPYIYDRRQFELVTTLPDAHRVALLLFLLRQTELFHRVVMSLLFFYHKGR